MTRVIEYFEGSISHYKVISTHFGEQPSVQSGVLGHYCSQGRRGRLYCLQPLPFEWQAPATTVIVSTLLDVNWETRYAIAVQVSKGTRWSAK